MASGISMDYAEIDALQQQLTAAQGELQNSISKIQSYVNACVNVSWTGQSAASFAQVHENWQQSAGQIQNAVGNFATFLNTAKNATQETDTSLAQGLNG